MRDVKRIERILKKLKEVWAIDRDLRFGQLVYIIYFHMKSTHKAEDNTHIDMFYVEDDEFEIALEEFINTYKNK